MPDDAKDTGTMLGNDTGVPSGEEPQEPQPGQDAGEGEQPAGDRDDSAGAGDAEEGKAEDGKDQGTEEPPEQYDFELPEGMEIDQDALQEFIPIAKELGLSREQAQKLVTVHAQAVQRIVQAQEEAWSRKVQSWAEAVKQDKELGGPELATKIETAKKALAAFGTPELTTLLDEMGLGNHPELVRFCYRVGKALAEDRMDNAAGSAAAPRNPAEVLYPGTGKE